MKKPSNMAAYRKVLSEKQDLIRLRELRIAQLENDLAAAKRREEIMRKELDLARQSSQLSGNLLVQVTAERDDWKNAFKTISRLVK